MKYNTVFIYDTYTYENNINIINININIVSSKM